MVKNTYKNRDLVLPFDIESLDQGVRVNQATFARMCGVTRQSVNQWVKQGKITLFPDGTLDPKRAAQSVFDNTDPARMRAKVFQIDIDESTDQLRDKHAQLIAVMDQLADSKKQVAYLEMFIEEIDLADEKLKDLLLQSQYLLAQAASESYPDLIESLFDEAILTAGRELGNI